MYRRFVTKLLIIIILSACSSPTQEPLPTETSQPVIEPTSTELPATPTPEPQNTPTFTPTTEANVETWEGVPIIPGAKDGQQIDSSYMYSVNVPVEEAEQFYKEKLEAEGWNLSTRETGPSTGGSKPILLVFEKDGELIRILLMGKDSSSIMLERVKP